MLLQTIYICKQNEAMLNQHIYLIFYGNSFHFLHSLQIERRALRFTVAFNKDPRGLHPICSLSLGSDSNLPLCEMASLAALHMWAANERKVCSPLHHNLLFIKGIYFLPLLCCFTGLQTVTKCAGLCSLMMIYESYPEDVVRSGGCAVGVNLGGDMWRVNKKYSIFPVIRKSYL